MRYKIYEPILVVGEDAYSRIDIRVRVKGGGHVSQIYAIRQAIAKALVAYYAKFEDAAEAISLKKALVAYDRTLLIADPRRMEPKKFGGQGARARRQKRFVDVRKYVLKLQHSFCLFIVTVKLYSISFFLVCMLHCTCLHVLRMKCIDPALPEVRQSYLTLIYSVMQSDSDQRRSCTSARAMPFG